MQLQIPRKITLVESSYWLDGGTVTLHAVTDSGEQCRIQLNQRCFADYVDPGRLYFNDECVGVRSDDESRIVELLRTASIETSSRNRPHTSEPPISKDALILSEDIKEFFENTPEQNLRRFRDDIVRYLESAEYVAIATNGLPRAQ